MRRLMLSGMLLVGVITPIFFASETLSEAPTHRLCFLAGAICQADCEGGHYQAYCRGMCTTKEDACHDAVKYGEKSFKFDRCGGFPSRRDCLQQACVESKGKNCIVREPGGRKKGDKGGKPAVESGPPIGPRGPVAGSDAQSNGTKGPQSTGTWTPTTATPTAPQPPASPVTGPAKPPRSPLEGILSKPYGGKWLP
jgi:hypothetical protein